ncbi:PLP-dependent transferase [Lentithecium fluviatile CBS 122367]|uniref:PLP-dependent transferase n=1 Tax=Lentithecium fluviatile CBS 122367 TaxID=1168545 RepID=A0A6G1JJ61_9PLEO|nr:PLP-dependent transferase [Lentithecium fluviatile CBS 122367]
MSSHSPPSSGSTLSNRGAALAARPGARDEADILYSRNWDLVTNPEGVVNLGTAENRLILDDVAEFIAEKKIKFEGADFDYGEGPWGSLRLRTAMAKFINAHFHPHSHLSPSNLTVSSGCTSLLSTLALTLANPNDAILLSSPSYIGFPSDMSLLAGLQPIYVRFPSSVDQFTSPPDAVVAAYSAALKHASDTGVAVKILVLCNPHNPLGRCYTKEVLVGIMQFCDRHEIHLVVDEIYALSVYSTPSATDVPFTSVLAVDWAKYIDENHLHQLYGLSKDFACGGLRIGSLYTRNVELQCAVSSLSVLHHSGTIPSLLASTLLEDTAWHDSFFATSRERLGRAAAFAKELLDKAAIPYAPGANAGFFLWVDLRRWLGEKDGDGGDEWAREEALSARMATEKVFMIGGRAQGTEEAGWYRFIFSRSEVVVREGVNRLVRALNASPDRCNAPVSKSGD